MVSYVRPQIDEHVIRDADGRAIEYGSRWDGSPPEDTYSVDTHPERFQPLHAVADALIDYLTSTYDVRIDEGIDLAADLSHPPSGGIVRAVRLRPSDQLSAHLTFVFTAYPGIFLRAGVLSVFYYPICGCDACDSTWQAEADELERQVLAVAEGRYRETINGTQGDARVGYAMTYADGSSSGESAEPDLTAERIERATAQLAELPGNWAAWPQRVRPQM